MLFNSLSFLFVFLPITVLGFFRLAHHSQQKALLWLGLASVFFYGWWDFRYIPLLLLSICFNYFVSKKCQPGETTETRRKRWLQFAVSLNLLFLAYFKYADFLLLSLNQLAGTSFPALHIVLPIGISFFTFTQIAFLVDTYQGKVQERRFLQYLLFVTWFPHLIAGPVLHHKEMMPQFADPKILRFAFRNWSVGLTVFVFGLAKKVLIADNLSPFAADLFDASPALSLLVAWNGVFAYALQLYFDFSGYSDMAIGLSLLFGVKLPLNFDSPYKAATIAEFWRCWHMTLSRFLRDYLYIPLGGNRAGKVRRYGNLLTTMLLGGMWHGAGWNFIVWGGLHGIYLVIHHAWASTTASVQGPRKTKLWRFLSVALTFWSVCIAWVYFRSSSFGEANRIVVALFGGNGVAVPESLVWRFPSLRTMLESAGAHFQLGGGARFIKSWLSILAAMLIVFVFPNTQEILRHYEPALGIDPKARRTSLFRFLWVPSKTWAYGVAIMAIVSLLALNQPTEFLYFQF